MEIRGNLVSKTQIDLLSKLYSVDCTRNQTQKLLTRARVILEFTGQSAGGHPCVLFLDTAHCHAEVKTFNDYTCSFCVDQLAECVCNLLSHSLLNLESTGKKVHEAGYFAETDNFTVGDVCHMSFPIKWKNVMLA